MKAGSLRFARSFPAHGVVDKPSYWTPESQAISSSAR